MNNATHTYWISIGRNVGAEPLNETEWGDFQSDVRLTCETFGTVASEVTGRSVSTGWAPEDTYLVLLETESDVRDRLARHLAPIGFQYGQDGIGLVGGPDNWLVT